MAFPVCKCICPDQSVACFTPNGTLILISTQKTAKITTYNYSTTISPYYSNLYSNYLQNEAQWVWCGN